MLTSFPESHHISGTGNYSALLSFLIGFILVCALILFCFLFFDLFCLFGLVGLIVAVTLLVVTAVYRNGHA